MPASWVNNNFALLCKHYNEWWSVTSIPKPTPLCFYIPLKIIFQVYFQQCIHEHLIQTLYTVAWEKLMSLKWYASIIIFHRNWEGEISTHCVYSILYRSMTVAIPISRTRSCLPTLKYFFIVSPRMNSVVLNCSLHFTFHLYKPCKT